MLEIADNLFKETANLKRRIQDLKKQLEEIPIATLSAMYFEHFQEFRNILVDETVKAFESTEEFNEPFFIDPLLNIIYTKDVIGVGLSGDRNSIVVGVNLEPAAGNIELYAEGIKYARTLISLADTPSKKKKQKKQGYRYNPERASKYWKDIIYGKKNLSGFSPGTPGGELQDQGSYGLTMSFRFDKFEGKAPYWELVDKGTPQPMSSQRGGTPHPTNIPTRFVTLAAQRISERANTLFAGKQKEITDRIKAEIADVERIDQEIARAVSQVHGSPETYKTPQIVTEIIAEGKAKYVYITEHSAIGFSGDPRGQGRHRLPKPR